MKHSARSKLQNHTAKFKSGSGPLMSRLRRELNEGRRIPPSQVLRGAVFQTTGLCSHILIFFVMKHSEFNPHLVELQQQTSQLNLLYVAWFRANHAMECPYCRTSLYGKTRSKDYMVSLDWLRERFSHKFRSIFCAWNTLKICEDCKKMKGNLSLVEWRNSLDAEANPHIVSNLNQLIIQKS